MEKCNDCENGLVGDKFCRECDGIGWLNVNHNARGETVPGTMTGESGRYVPDADAVSRRVALYAARHRHIRDQVQKNKLLVDEETTIFYNSDPPVVPPAACSGSMTLESLARCYSSSDGQSEFDDDDFDEDESL